MPFIMSLSIVYRGNIGYIFELPYSSCKGNTRHRTQNIERCQKKFSLEVKSSHCRLFISHSLTFSTRIKCRKPRYFFSKRYKSLISCVFSCSICAVVMSVMGRMLVNYSPSYQLTTSAVFWLTFQAFHPLPSLSSFISQFGRSFHALAGLLGLLHNGTGSHYIRGYGFLFLLPRYVHQCPVLGLQPYDFLSIKVFGITYYFLFSNTHLYH